MKKTILLFLLALAGNAAPAQTVELYDLEPGFYTDTLTSTSGHIRLGVAVKIQNVAQADSIYFMLGTTINASDVSIYKRKFILSGSDYFIDAGPVQYPVSGNFQIYDPLNLPLTEFNAAHYVSVRVKDVSGNLSGIVSMLIN